MPLQVAEVSLEITSTSIPPQLTGTTTSGGLEVTTVKGGTSVAFNLTITGSVTSTTWTVAPGSAAVTLTGSGNVLRTIAAPYLTDQDDVLVNVTATGAGGSATYSFAVTVVPTLLWYLDGSSVWRPYKGGTVL